MDFTKMMSAANKNAQKAAREVDRIQHEPLQVNHEKNEVQRQLEAEKRARIEMQRRKMEKEKELARKRAEREEEDRRRNFTIPKRNEPPSSSTGKSVNTSALRAVLDRQKAEKEEKEKKAEQEKQRLMMLRMQANGGKATKKMGKQFGLDVIDLQTRFGGNNSHLEVLQKRKWKEEEEQEAETDKFRSGVFKAVVAKQKNEGALRTSTTGQPHRVSTSKSNSLAGLCSRHEKTRDTFSPPKDGKKASSSRAEQPTIEKKKIQAAAPIDFKSLMAAASDISQGKSVNLDHLKTKPAAGQQKPSSSSSSSSSQNSAEREKQREKERIREKQQQEKMKEAEKQRYRLEKERERERERARAAAASAASASSKSRPSDAKTTTSSGANSHQNGKDLNGMRKKEAPAVRKPFQKGPTPPPLIPAAIPGKKYLPGDVRYQESMKNAATSNGASSSSANSANSKDRILAIREAEKQREREREKQRALKRAREEKEFREYQREQKMRKMSSSSGSASSAFSSSKSSAEAKRNYEARRMAELREQQMREKKRKEQQQRHRTEHNGHHRSSDSGRGSLWKGADDYTDEDEDDEEMDDDRYDEYDDSDMDDFIDDTEVDMDRMSRKEFEDTLRMVNRKYDTEKWSRREKAIDVRSMDSNYRRIQSEENFSSRAGIMEDLREASKGRSVRL